MLDFLKNNQWLFISLAFFGIIFYISWLRWRDRKWIDKRFGGRKILATSFGVNYFGRASEPGSPRRSSGFLLLLSDRLFYRSRFAGLELEIPGARIVRVYHDRHHKGINLHQSVIKVDFLNSRKQKDTAAFKVPYPPQWIQAIESTLLQDRRPPERQS
ncbi:MAG: hypothetical protein JSW39_02720 [Desulfobacterales bacterium]|nr:MAG: hypothetical protein JSW39_02720 [Desulfobacterales bacterium]